MTAREVAKEFAYQQYLKEKVLIDEVVRKIYEEDARLREAEMQKKEEQRRYIEQFKQEQKIWNQREEERLKAEAAKIKQYEEEQIARLEQRKAKQVEEAAEKRKVSFNFEPWS